MRRISKSTIALIVWVLFCAFATVWMAQNLMAKAYEAGYAEGRKNWEVDVAAGFERGVEKGWNDAIESAIVTSYNEDGYEIMFGDDTYWYE